MPVPTTQDPLTRLKASLQELQSAAITTHSVFRQLEALGASEAIKGELLVKSAELIGEKAQAVTEVCKSITTGAAAAAVVVPATPAKAGKA